MTVEKNVRYGLEVLHVTREEARRRVEEVLALVSLGDLGDRLPSQLSGGQQQRVALARSLVVQPSLLLLDEPLSNLDAALRDRVRIELRTLLKRIGIASVYVTHDQREALSVSDRVVLMNEGRLLQEGSPEQLYENPTSLFAADFLGRPNLLPVENLRGNGTSAVGEVRGIGRIAGRIAQPPLDGGCLAMIRRERARLLRPGEPAGGNTWHIRILERLYEGATVEYMVKLGDHQLKVVSGDSGFREGDQATVNVDERDVVFLRPQQA
jgi:ABC-type Fe3+/spermidine/putrescine transport system ATPase subunit